MPPTMSTTVVFAVLVTVCIASSLRENGHYTSNSNNYYFGCPSDGLFSNPKNCSTFYNCYQGSASLQSCPPGLEYNPDPHKKYCDYPVFIPQRVCTRTVEPDFICHQGIPNKYGSHYVPHPRYCNAYISCGNYYVYPPCGFCENGQIFSTTSFRCEPYSRSMCGNKIFIEPAEQEIRKKDNTCNPKGHPYEKVNRNKGHVYPTHIPTYTHPSGHWNKGNNPSGQWNKGNNPSGQWNKGNNPNGQWNIGYKYNPNGQWNKIYNPNQVVYPSQFPTHIKQNPQWQNEYLPNQALYPSQFPNHAKQSTQWKSRYNPNQEVNNGNHNQWD